jgi:putative AdoMet-dependent methyltransferase
VNQLDKKRALFDNWAVSYDEDVKNPSGILEGYNKSLAIAADVVNVEENGKVLDIGIGTGGFASLVKGKNAATIYGIDLSPKMLSECGKKHPEFQLKEGIFTDTGFPDSMFDAVISSFCFHEVDLIVRKKACDEVYRVLKPGGRFVLVDIMFASVAALGHSKSAFHGQWDNSEDYSFVSHVDGILYEAGFSSVHWAQTARCHWVVVADK